MSTYGRGRTPDWLGHDRLPEALPRFIRGTLFNIMAGFLLRTICLALLLARCAPAQQQRGVVLPTQRSAIQGNGAYYALIIGIDDYQNLPKLQTAVGDAQALDQILRQRYGFQTTLLINAHATRSNILDAFSDYRDRLHDNDNLLIYYAGHGARDGGRAYWLPVDSRPKSPANWIIAEEITKGMQVMPARHVLIISDSCYSGGLSRDIRVDNVPTDRAKYLQTMIDSKSRVLISSGRDEPVADGGSGGHSVFANALLRGLRGDTDPIFTASNLFHQFVEQAVIGGSRQVPLYQLIQDSGHEFGDFVFVARSAASATLNRPPDSGTTPVPAGGGSARPGRKSSSRLAVDGRSATAAPADATGALPLTDYRVSLLEYRDWPQTISDSAMFDIAKWQVIAERSMWTLLDKELAGSPGAGVVLNPQRKTFVFEWQKVIESDPALATNALLPIFLRPDPDWSFLRKQKDWDEQYDAYVYVTLFARDKIQGREPDFVARDLAPLVKKHLQMAVAKAPTKLYFDVPLQSSYDVGKGQIRFSSQDSNQPADTVELIKPVAVVQFAAGPVDTLPPPTERDMHTLLPPAARATANYNRSFEMKDTPSARPSAYIYGADPQEAWRKNINGNTQDFHTVSLGAFALDRQLKLSAIPFDAAKAEPMVQALRNLHARVYLSVEKLDRFRVSYERAFQPIQAIMFAKVLGIQILGPKDEPIASIAASSLPVPAAPK
jgi:Caspase domain